MVDDLGPTYQGEAHAEAEDAARVGHKVRLGGFYLAKVTTGIRVLTKKISL